MRCTHCGSIIPPGLCQCPICGTYADTQQAQEDYRFYQQYPKTDYQQGVPPTGREYGYAVQEPVEPPKQYATPAFHTYRKPLLNGYSAEPQTPYANQARDGYRIGNAFMRTLADFPAIVKGGFTNPTDTAIGMIRREDRLTGGLLVLLTLILSFLTATIMVQGILGTLFTTMGNITGLQLADSTASLNQGVSYLAGRVAVPIGGVVAACQLMAIVTPLAVSMVYLCVMCQVRFSFLLVSGFVAMLCLPNVAALLLAAVGSLLSPYLAIVFIVLGQILSYILLCDMVTQIGHVPPERAVMVQSMVVCLSVVATIVMIAVFGGLLMGGVMSTLTSLTNSMSSLL